MPAEFIYTTYKLSRHYPPDRTVLEDISISFYPGAKIGVIGANGAGKSSLLRIMAGLDDGFNGDARLTPGFSVGYLSQEPQLDPTKTVKENVLDGVREVQALIDQYNAVMAKWSEPDADYEASAPSRRRWRTRSTPSDAWNVERNVEIAMDALRCPPDDADVTTLSGGEKRRVALVPAAAQHPDLLLLDEPTNHLDAESVEWLERFLKEYSGTVVAVTHDRYFLDNVAQVDPRARPGEGHPVRRQLLELARAEARTDVARAEAGRRAAADSRARARMGAHGREGPTGQGQGPTQRVREAAGGGERRPRCAAARAGDRHPARTSAGRHGHRGQRTAQGLRRSASDRGPDVLAAARGHRRDHRAQRRRQDHAVPDARRARRRPTPARSRSATRSS